MLLLSPWLWNDDGDGSGYWAAPEGCRASIDLASLGQIEAATTGQPRGWGIFECAELPKELIDLGGVAVSSDDIREARPDEKMLDAWESLLGYRPGGDTIADLVWDQLTAGADPLNADRSGVLMPTISRRLELIFGGAVLRSDRFDFGQHPHTAQVTAVLKRQLEQARIDALDGKLISPVTKLADGEYHRRIADAILEKYAGPNESLKAELYPLLKPSTWLANEVPLAHETTISESFNKADSGTLGPDLAWTEVQGDMEVFSNQCRGVTAPAIARADSDLSGVDHYAQCSVVSQGSSNTAGDRTNGPVCRKDSTATLTCYHAGLNLATGTAFRLWKVIAGTLTQLGTDATVTVSLPQTAKVTANGSSIVGAWAGTDQITQTDTAITTGTRCGLRMKWTSAVPILDDFSAADLSGGGSPTYPQGERITRGVMRGVFSGAG